MTPACEICRLPEKNRDMLFGCSCASCGGIHQVHQLCAKMLGVWAPWDSSWGVTACPAAVQVANALMGDE